MPRMPRTLTIFVPGTLTISVPTPRNPAGQAYYDSIARLYASWGVDLIKVDCISSRPYKGEDIRMLSVASAKPGAQLC